MSQGLCEHSPATVAALQDLHPNSAAPTVPVLDDLPLAPLLDSEDVTQALRTFPADTAPGPTGLRVQHLREALGDGRGAGLLDQLTAVVNLLAQGRACSSVAPLLAGAGLVAIPKPSGGARPIAVGELLRRLTAKCLMHVVRAEARDYLWPAQAGVAVQGGAEAAVHALRAWVGRNAGSHDAAVVKIDFQNAFNTISRDAVLREAGEQFPALARWTTWCYQRPTHLQFGDTVLQSASGVQQGDPLGPLLFSAGVQPLAQIRARWLFGLLPWWWGAGRTAGRSERIQQGAAALGLSVNLAKSEAITVGMTSAAALAATLPRGLISNDDGSSRILSDFEFLGAAIGSPAHLQAHAAARVDGARKLLEAVGGLPDPQVALRLLRASAGYARLVHTMRCCPPAGHATALATFDGLVQESFSSLSGLHLEPAQWEQATRGFAQAGLGLRSSRAHAPAAYLASVGASSRQCQELDPGYWVDHSGDVAAALAELNAVLGPDQQLTVPGALALAQSELSRRVDAAGWASQLNSASVVDKATLLSEASPGARAFLTCVPSGRTQMEPAVFNAELRVRLSIPESGSDTWCPKCDAILDTYGHHSGMCAAGGERTQRHNALRDLIYHGLSADAFALSARRLACCCPRVQMMWAVPAGGLPTCTSQRFLGAQLQLTSPSRRLSGWTSWARMEVLRLPRCTLNTRGSTLILPKPALPNMWSFFLWLPRPPVLGRRKQSRPLTISAARLVLPVGALCSNRLVSWSAAGGREQPFADAPSWMTPEPSESHFSKFGSAVTGLCDPSAFAPFLNFGRAVQCCRCLTVSGPFPFLW